jgi:hypothetical protein
LADSTKNDDLHGSVPDNSNFALLTSSSAAENKEALALTRKFPKADTRPSTKIRLPARNNKRRR